ncbi:MAG: DUF5916 domain-containing protein [Calditrichia bacterium]
MAELNLPERKAIAVFTTKPPAIDGMVDEVWLKAPANKGFVQRVPEQGSPATTDTRFYILFDKKNIYFLFFMLDPETSTIPARLVDRDHRFYPDDSINFYLDTYNDNRKAFYFSTNPKGVQQDGLISENGDNIDMSWDCIYKVGSRVNGHGWVAEFSIPYNSIRFKDDLKYQVWGFNAWRIRKNSRENSYWSLVDQNYREFRLDKGGVLIGMKDIRAGNNLDLLPYVTSRVVGTGANQNEWDYNKGLDLKYGLTSDLALDFTLNPDFGQVEIDEEQINLDKRYEIQLEEKRPFFLENKNLFQTPFYQLFYSRRVGLESNIKAGAKVTGKIGPYSVGLMGASTGDWENFGLGDPNTGATDELFSVVRVQRDVMRSSNVGFMAVDREANLGGRDFQYNRAGGMDWSLYSGQNYFIGQMVYSTNSLGNKAGAAGYGSMGRYGRLFYVDLHAIYYEPDFDINNTGFFQKLSGKGKKQFGLYTEIHPFINSRFIRQWGASIAPLYIQDSDETQPGFGVKSSLWVTAPDESRFEVGFSRYREVETNFLTSQDELRYWGSDFYAEVETDEGKPISLGVRWNYDSQYYFQTHSVGNNEGFEGTVTFKPLSNAFIELGHKRRWFMDKERRFMPLKLTGQPDVRIWTMRARYLLTKNVFSRVFLQYTNGAEEPFWTTNELTGDWVLLYDVWDRISANLLIGWRFKPGSTIYLAYTEERDKRIQNSFDLNNRILFLKFSYWWSL